MCLHLVMFFGSRLELGSLLSQRSVGKGKQRQKAVLAQWDSDIAGW